MSNNLLDYERFKEKILEDTIRFYGDAAGVELRSVVKNNGVRLDGLTITEKGSNISPAIYLNGFYDDYRCGRSINDIIQAVVETYERNRAEKCFDVGSFRDFESIKQNLGIRLINYEKNRDELAGMPHRRFVDLAVVYMLVFNHTGFGNASMLIKNEHRNFWGVDDDELHAAALAGALRIQRPVVRHLGDYLSNFLDVGEPENDMLVLTNENGLYGASVMVYKDLLRETARRHGRDLYVLPSSVHELIVLPVRDAYDPEELKNMVRTVNETVVEASEVLSDNVYIYSSDEDRLSLVS